jgi:ATP-dependent DNA ligase
MAKWLFSTKRANPTSMRWPQRKHDKRAMLYAFDLLASDGEDLRPLPLSMRKVALAQLPSDRSMASA